MTNSIVGIGLLLFGIALLPVLLNWIKTVHCPKCKSWFTLEFVRFDVTDKVIGRDKTRYNGGYHAGWRGGFGGGTSHTRDNPFIREWGKARYLCKKCGLHLTIETHRDKR